MIMDSSLLNEESWTSGAKDEFSRLCTTFLETLKSSPNDTQAYEGLRRILYDVLFAVVRGQIKTESVLPSIAEFVKTAPQVCNVFTDLLLVLDLETTEQPELRESYLRLLQQSNNKIIADWLLKERLEYETVADAKIIPNLKLANQRFVRFKTRLFYKQQKFNLFREESEGYSKLITELISNRNAQDVGHTLTVVKSLIGCFNLDPNRVLDLILESMECMPDSSDLYLELIKHFMPSPATLNQILGLKFSFYHNDRKCVTPSSLCDVAAALIAANVIELDDLYPYLLPTDKAIVDYHKEDLEIATNIRKRVNIVSVGGGNEGEAKQIPEEVSLADERRHQLFVNNQKLLLLASVLKAGDWTTGKNLIGRLPEYFAAADEQVCSQLTNMIHCSVEKLFREYNTLPGIVMRHIRPFAAPHGHKHLVAQSIEDLKRTTFPLICTVGPYLHRDVKLLVKLVRLCRALYEKHCIDPNETRKESGNDDSPRRRNRTTLPTSNGTVASTDPCLWLRNEILTLLDDSICPSISALESNSGLLEELWALVSLFPYNVRYRLYTSWKVEPLQSSLLLKNRAQVHKRIKYIMKRLSKETVKPTGRNIGKLSHSNPPYLFDYILSQIQSYDNLIGPVADSLKYLSNLSYDVLVFCIIEALSNPTRDRTQFDGAGISPWIIALSQFAGAIVRKYTVELTGLLQFIANKLQAKQSLDLLVLKEVIQKMSGIETGEELTQDQLEALTGGELLRSEGGYYNAVRNTKKPANRLKDALLADSLAMPLCILIAQQRNCITYHENAGQSHIKLIGKLYDHCQETIIQYGSFLSSMMSTEDYVAIMPPEASRKFFTQYHLNPDVAFFLLRPTIIHNITKLYDELRKAEGKSITPSKCVQFYSDAADQVIGKLVATVMPCFPLKFWEEFNCRFFVTFWTLTMYDIHVPTESYDRENKRLREQIQQADENKDLALAKRKKERERGLAMMEKLMDEETRQIDHVKRVSDRLRKDTALWFDPKTQKMEMTTKFLQYCLFPRAIFSALDAHFCAKFIHLLHSLRTPNFSTLICYDRIFGDITFTLASCTEREAHNYGRFLCNLLTTVMHWHKDAAKFDSECGKFPGFVTKFNPEQDPVYVDYEDYRHVCHKWHYRLTKAFIVLLESKEYIQIRNALIALTRIITHFPAITHFASVIEKRVDTIREEEKEKRRDLSALAIGYAGQLKMRKATFIPESDFHHKPPPKVAKPSQSSSQGSVKPKSNGQSSAQATQSSKSSSNQPLSNGVKKTENGPSSNSETKSQPLKTSVAQDVKSSDGRSSAPSPKRSEPSDRSDADERNHKRRKTDEKNTKGERDGNNANSQPSRDSSKSNKSSGRKRDATGREQASASPDIEEIMVLEVKKPRRDEGSNADRGHGGRERNSMPEPIPLGKKSGSSGRSANANSTSAKTSSKSSSQNASSMPTSTIQSVGSTGSSRSRNRHDK